MGSDTTFLMEPIGTFSVLSAEKNTEKKEEHLIISMFVLQWIQQNEASCYLTLCSDPQLILLQFECESNFSSGLVKHSG